MRPVTRLVWLVLAVFTAYHLGPRVLCAEERANASTQSELAKLQGLWQTSPGGMEHQDGHQVVRNPVLDGPCFFVVGDRLIWLDPMGKPTGAERTITLDVRSQPMQVTLTPREQPTTQKPIHGIFSATDSSVIIHTGLDGGPAPKQFLELNKPVKGIDGEEWLISRKTLTEN